MNSVTECIITANWDKKVYTQPLEVLKYFRGKVIDLILVCILQMVRNIILCNMTWPCA